MLSMVFIISSTDEVPTVAVPNNVSGVRAPSGAIEPLRGGLARGLGDPSKAESRRSNPDERLEAAADTQFSNVSSSSFARVVRSAQSAKSSAKAPNSSSNCCRTATDESLLASAVVIAWLRDP